MTCNFAGLPVPTIKWYKTVDTYGRHTYKNGRLIENGIRFRFSADMQTLDIDNLVIEDGGEFKCIGENRLGSAVKYMTLYINGKTNATNLYNKILIKKSTLSSVP